MSESSVLLKVFQLTTTTSINKTNGGPGNASGYFRMSLSRLRRVHKAVNVFHISKVVQYETAHKQGKVNIHAVLQYPASHVSVTFCRYLLAFTPAVVQYRGV